MAIAKPSNMMITLNAALSTDSGQGRVLNTPVAQESLVFPFQSYAQGSIDITSLSGVTVLGKYGICFLSASSPITVETTDTTGTSTHVTKLFALNGDGAEIAISTPSVIPITVTFLLGTAAV